MNRSAKFHSRQHRKHISRRIGEIEAVDFFNALTSPALLALTEAHLPEHRERLYPPTVTLSMFMQQALQQDGSCQQVVNGWTVRRVAEGLRANSIRTAAYCKARQRLPIEMVTALSGEIGRCLSAQARDEWRWRGRTVKLVDGTTISMPDTPENQACYPQPSSQACGVGFPLARLVGVICLSTGAVLDAAMGPYAGKGSSEFALLRRLTAAFSPGDVMLADAYYGNYFLIATLIMAGVDVLFEQHGGRNTDFRRGQALGKRDHKVQWPKPTLRPEWMTQQQYERFPDEISVRETQVDGHILITTMHDPHQVSKHELSALYALRWNVELDLRNIKTTLGMDILSCQTPQMNEKEMWVHLLAYNVIRLLMTQSALKSAAQPRELSFKHTVQMWMAWRTQRLSRNYPNAILFRLIAQLKVGNRPGRIEPRARKRRPKPYPLLAVARAKARQQILIHA